MAIPHRLLHLCITTMWRQRIRLPLQLSPRPTAAWIRYSIRWWWKKHRSQTSWLPRIPAACHYLWTSPIFSQFGNFYSWDFGNGNTGVGAINQQVFDIAGTYLVDLTVANSSGCTDSISKTVTAYPVPNAAIHLCLFSGDRTVSSCLNSKIDQQGPPATTGRLIMAWYPIR